MREPCVTIVIGAKGAGKTYRTVQFLQEYARIHKNRKAIIFDVNAPFEQSYKAFKRIDATQIAKLKGSTIRRVTPHHLPSGVPLTLDEKCDMLFYLMAICKNGVLVIEDMNNYLLGTNLKQFISVLTTNRHKDLDIIVQLQSLSATTPRLWQNCNYVRFHYISENLARIKNRIPDYELFRLAQLIVARHYRAGNTRHYIYVDTMRFKLLGVSPLEFEYACADMLELDRTDKKVQKYIAKNSHYLETY